MRVKRVFQSFYDAINGIKYVFRHEQNFQIQLLLTIFVVFLVWFFPLSKGEIIVIILLIFLVLILELMNSAFEKLADVLKPRLSQQIAMIKDIMAAMVLVASIGALIIGMIIFWPYLFELFC